MAEKTQEKPKATQKKSTSGKKTARQVPEGNAYIQASYNNTIITISDSAGNVLGWSSAGVVGFKGPKKATPFAASMIVKNVAEKVAPYGVKDLHVFVKGIGGGREGAIRALNANGFFVKTIKDSTPLPHNGCRPPKPRRV
ncbi:MAG: 30S ribosomal protein S11 [Patescibacteria group bacterium]